MTPEDKINYALSLVNLIALSPLIPAALRLALAAQVARNNVSGTPAEEEDRQLWASLDAFLAMLPEPPKEATE